MIPEPIFRNNNKWELLLPEFAIILDNEYLFEYEQNIKVFFAFYQGGKKELLIFHANNADSNKIFQRFEINGILGDSRTDSRRMALFQYNNFPPDLFCLKYDNLGNTKIVKFLPKIDTFSEDQSLRTDNFKMSLHKPPKYPDENYR